MIGRTLTRCDDVVVSEPAPLLPETSITSYTLHKYASMPRLDENTENLLRDTERGVRSKTSGAWDSFSNFALRDNVLEVAVGLM